MNIAVINSKGGVGKSTISIQVAASYLYMRTNTKVNHFEFDDENEDNKAFEKSEIINTFNEKVSRTNLRDRITDILLDYEQVVFDVGANKTTTFFVTALKESGMMPKIDLFIIPLMDGENDGINALKIYHELKAEDANANILFALNRINTNRELHSQFNVFLGDKRGVFNDSGLIDEIDEADQRFISIEDSDAVKYSKNFGLCIYELALLQRDISTEIKEALKNGASKEAIKMLSFKKGVKDDCEEYYRINLEPAYTTLNEVLKDHE
jgi:hypothetical protein